MSVRAFQVGKTYTTRSMADYECIFSFTILSRTSQFVTTEVHGRKVNRKVTVRDDVEQFKPLGNYSMAPIIKADKSV